MVLSLGMEGGLSADKSWGDFHMITDTLNGQQPRQLIGTRATVGSIDGVASFHERCHLVSVGRGLEAPATGVSRMRVTSR